MERRIAAEKELLFWESVKDSTHAADFEAYLKQFPGGTYEALARNRLGRLTVSPVKTDVQVTVTPDEPERVVSPEPRAPAPEAMEAALGLDREERRRIQRGLASSGFDPGAKDGLFGQRTRKALETWQSSQEMAATGYLDVEAAKVLLETGQAAEPGERGEEAEGSGPPCRRCGICERKVARDRRGIRIVPRNPSSGTARLRGATVT